MVSSHDIEVLTAFGTLLLDPNLADNAVAAAWDKVVIDDDVTIEACGIARHMILHERPTAFALWERATFPDGLTYPSMN